MAARTDEDKVKEVLMSDYGPKSDGSLPPLDSFIRAANLVTTRVYECSVRNSLTLSDEELVEIETWLAAHYYVQSDQVFASRSEAGASMSFQGQLGMGLENSKYGQAALNLDYSGCLRKVLKGQRAMGAWLGKPKSSQQTWEQRNEGTS